MNVSSFLRKRKRSYAFPLVVKLTLNFVTGLLGHKRAKETSSRRVSEEHYAAYWEFKCTRISQNSPVSNQPMKDE